MRKVILFIGLSVFAISCKRQYSCSCTVTYTSNDPNLTGGGTVYNFEISEATKKQASLACNEATVKETQNIYNTTRVCKLSK